MFTAELRRIVRAEGQAAAVSKPMQEQDLRAIMALARMDLLAKANIEIVACYSIEAPEMWFSMLDSPDVDVLIRALVGGSKFNDCLCKRLDHTSMLVLLTASRSVLTLQPRPFSLVA
jgi:hypothetical protein